MDGDRLSVHFEPQKGWINDPNGLCFFQGQVHAFFQHYPYAAHWGPMHWGHAVSRDLLHWRELPIALSPDQPYEDGGGCFSGSAVEKDGRLWLFYTSVSKERGQAQSVAFSDDGVAFTKYPGNPVIPQSPLDPASKDFRDPKVFPYGDGYRMVVGAGAEGLASILLFRSADLLRWEYVGPLFQTGEMGPVCECPDLFPLGDRWALLFSRMDTGAAQFILGDFDGERFTPQSFQQPETGTDFYAPQTFLDGRGRRLCVAWLYHWKRPVPEGAARAGALTVPREVRLEDGRVLLAPAEEAAPLLRAEDPCLSRRDGALRVSNGREVLLEMPEDQVRQVQVLADGPAREVFLNGGERTCTFYWEG